MKIIWCNLGKSPVYKILIEKIWYFIKCCHTLLLLPNEAWQYLQDTFLLIGFCLQPEPNIAFKIHISYHVLHERDYIDMVFVSFHSIYMIYIHTSIFISNFSGIRIITFVKSLAPGKVFIVLWIIYTECCDSKIQKDGGWVENTVWK